MIKRNEIKASDWVLERFKQKYNVFIRVNLCMTRERENAQKGKQCGHEREYLRKIERKDRRKQKVDERKGKQKER